MSRLQEARLDHRSVTEGQFKVQFGGARLSARVWYNKASFLYCSTMTTINRSLNLTRPLPALVSTSMPRMPLPPLSLRPKRRRSGPLEATRGHVKRSLKGTMLVPLWD